MVVDENMREKRDRTIDAPFTRSRSLSTLELGGLTDVQSIKPSADFGEFENQKDNLFWFQDVRTARRKSDFETTQSAMRDPSNKIQYDCFGFSLFDMAVDGQLAVEPTPVEPAPVEPELFLTPGEAEKAARRARRRRSKGDSYSNLTRHSDHGASFSGHATRRRSTGIRELEALAPQQASAARIKGSASKMRRSKSAGDGGLNKLKQEEVLSNQLQPAKKSKRRKRQSGTRKKRSSSESGLGKMSLMEQSSSSIESQKNSIPPSELQESNHESCKPRRRDGSKRRSLAHQTSKGSLGSSLRSVVTEHEQNEHGGRKQRRNSSKRSEVNNATTTNPSTSKRLVRSGKSLTSLTSMLLEEQQSNRRRASTSN